MAEAAGCHGPGAVIALYLLYKASTWWLRPNMFKPLLLVELKGQNDGTRRDVMRVEQSTSPSIIKRLV